MNAKLNAEQGEKYAVKLKQQQQTKIALIFKTWDLELLLLLLIFVKQLSLQMKNKICKNMRVSKENIPF